MEDTAIQSIRPIPPREPWNKGKLVGQKAPFKLKEVWAIRVWLQLEHRTRELALFDLGLDSKLRSCDLVKLRVRDVCHGDRVAPRATVMQQKTSRPVQFEITESTRSAVADWMKLQNLHSEDYLFPSRIHKSPHLGTRQYARIVQGWVKHVGLDPCAYGTHSIRRTKATLIYKRTKNLRAVQLLLGMPSWKVPYATWVSKSMMHWRCLKKQTSDAPNGHARGWPGNPAK